LILPYSDREKTFLGVAENDPTGRCSVVLPTERAAQARPFTFTFGHKMTKRLSPYPQRQRKSGENGVRSILY